MNRAREIIYAMCRRKLWEKGLFVGVAQKLAAMPHMNEDDAESLLDWLSWQDKYSFSRRDLGVCVRLGLVETAYHLHRRNKQEILGSVARVRGVHC